MTTVGQAATAEIVTVAAAAPGWLARAIGFGAVALALLSAFATFVVLAGLTPIPPSRRRGRAAARLHVRIVGLFSVVAAVPAILVAVVASVTLERGLDRLFSRQTQS